MKRTFLKAAIATCIVSLSGLALAQDKGTIGISMPTKSSARWIDDGNNMVKVLKERGYKTDLQYADDDIPNQLAQVENMITKGSKVLVIAAIDGTTLSKALQNAADKGIKIIRSQTGDFTRAKGKEVMEAFLKAEGKKINVLYAHNDDMAIGAIQAIEEAGMKPAKDITIISIDAVKGAFEAMMAGKLNVSVECSPLLGPQLMSAVKDIMAGKTVQKRIVTEEGIFPMEVASKEFPKRKY